MRYPASLEIFDVCHPVLATAISSDKWSAKYVYLSLCIADSLKVLIVFFNPIDLAFGYLLDTHKIILSFLSLKLSSKV
jgi:hypothetical protein